MRDLTANLSRIHEHGERANSIVRRMLAHAGSAGECEPADLNALVAGAVSLAYQGFVFRFLDSMSRSRALMIPACR